jgi:anti-sigma factor RsiW
MPCDRHAHLLSAYLDRELPDDEHEALARHIADCPDCATLVSDLRQTSSAVAGLGREPMPEGLSQRLRQSLEQESDASLPTPSPQSVSALSASIVPRHWTASALMQQAAVLVFACLLSALATWWFVTGSARDTLLARDLLSAHLRSLQQESPIQVASSDAHTVKPWFAGKVDFSPEVRDLAAQGYPLLGGRLDTIAGRRVGALVYKRRLHLINVFAWASDAPDTSPTLTIRNGYNLLSWIRGGVVYTAVSDLDGDELKHLSEMF